MQWNGAELLNVMSQVKTGRIILWNLYACDVTQRTEKNEDCSALPDERL